MTTAVPITRRWRGTVCHVDGAFMVGTRGLRIYESRDAGVSWRHVVSLPAGALGWIGAGSGLLRRLLRTGVHHVLVVDSTRWVVFASRRIYEIDSVEGTVRSVEPQAGSRPLAPCVHGGAVYYGEYRGNVDRRPVSVFVKRPGMARFEVAHQFTGVRHVHGIFSDPWSGALYVTTGDEDHESAIWRTDDEFRTIDRVVSGSQQTRAVGLLFTEDAILFGSDTPLEQNYLYRLPRASSRPARVQAVQGSIFYGASGAFGHLFATVCEPSPVNRDRHTRVWWSGDGHQWREVASFRKDRLPSKLFQYGQTLFPRGPGDGRAAWVTPFATEGDQQSVCLDFSRPPDGGVREAPE